MSDPYDLMFVAVTALLVAVSIGVAWLARLPAKENDHEELL